MKVLLSAAGRAFLRTFAASLVVYEIGLSHAANLNGAVAIGVAGALGAVAAGLRAVQAYIPKLTFSKWLPIPWGALADAFVHGFLAAFILSVTGWLDTPNLSTWHSAIVGAVVGGLNAGLRAIQALTTVEEPPARGRGISEPANG